MSAPYILYGAEASYFTAKIAAYLRARRIPFEQVLATRTIYRDQILPRVGWPVVPVLVTPEDVTLQDTSEMVDYLEVRHTDLPAIPASPARRVLSYLLELYADEWLKMPALHYRWNHNYDFAVAEFGRITDPEQDTAAQIEVGRKVGARFYAWLPELGIDARTIAAIEAEYAGLLADLEVHFAVSPYLLGDTPSLADFAFFGPFYAHLLRDPASGAIMRQCAPRVVAWIERLRTGVPGVGPHGPDDSIPSTLLAFVERLGADYVPVLMRQTMLFQDWLRAHPDEVIPRIFGTQEFTIGSGRPHAAQGERALFSYDQWMLQRVLDAYAALDEDGRARAAALLAGIGAADLLRVALPIRIRRANFALERE